MKSLKMECLHNKTDIRNQTAFEKPPDYIDSTIIDKFKGEYIVKTPLWAIQHCLSLPNPSTKTYSFEKLSPFELSMAADGMFVICGFINPLCRQGMIDSSRTDLPHDPSYNIVSLNRCKNSIPTVVVYFPSTGTYYLPRFFVDNSQLRSKGLCLQDDVLATKSVLQMLPGSALGI